MSSFNYDIIEAYVSGELSGQALIDFETQMQGNADLAKEVMLYKTIGKELAEQQSNEKDEKNLRATLNQIGASEILLPQAKVVTMKKKYWAMGIAAGIALLIVFKPWQTEPLNEAQLFADNFNSSIDSLPTANRSNKIDSTAILISTLFNNKEYKKALVAINSIDSSKLDGSMQIAKAVCLMQTEQLDKALPVLQQVAAGQSVFSSKAIWYQSLVYLKQKNKLACVLALQQISNDADDYKKAKALLQKLK